MGLGTAYMDGFRTAFNDGAKFIAQMDADLSHPPEELPAMLKILRGADVVVGSRYAPGGAVDPDWNIARKLLSSFGNSWIRLLTGVRVKDATAGFKIFTRETMAKIPLESMRISGFGFQAEMAIECERAMCRVVEHPYTFAERSSGSSKMSIGIVFEAAWRLLLLRLTK